jgi:hypothetical protein
MREFMPDLDCDRIDWHRAIRVEDVLAWADAHHAQHGKWPTEESGKIPETGDSWGAISDCLRIGLRGLRGGSSLARLLEEHRGVPVGQHPAHLSEQQILAWADAYFAAQGKWPTQHAGPIPGTKETWNGIASAFWRGWRGLRGGTSLAQLLAKRRAARNIGRLPPLTEKQILAWADAYFAAQGKWPAVKSGLIAGTSETWSSVETALQGGRRGLRGGASLAQLLAERRGMRNRQALAPLKETRILSWAKAHHKVTGGWPTCNSGPVAQSAGETWLAVNTALDKGKRGLPGGSSLAKLLRKHGLK